VPNTGNTFPTVGANVDRAGNTEWADPGNVVSDNTTYTDCVEVPSDYLVCSGFGFAIPAGAKITGVILRVEALESGGGNSSYIPQLISATTPALIGSAKSAVTVSGTSPTVSTTGSATDLWGALQLTPAIVNDAGFGVAVWSDDTLNELLIDYVTLDIYYTGQRLALGGVG
jgi:hypothetical protein